MLTSDLQMNAADKTSFAGTLRYINIRPEFLMNVKDQAVQQEASKNTQ
jgi:hypothetical protein